MNRSIPTQPTAVDKTPANKYTAYYPRMTSKVRALLEQVEGQKLSREWCRGSVKQILMLLMWDGWIKVMDDEAVDIRLTASGRAWMARDRERQIHNGI